MRRLFVARVDRAVATFVTILAIVLRLALTLLVLAAGAPAQSAPSADALLQQGVAAMQKGDTAAATALFHRVLSLRPYSYEAHTYLGVLADQSGNVREAEQQFAAAVAAVPARAAAHNNYGAVLAKLGRTDQAAAEFETSLKLEPRQVDTLVNLGQVRAAQGTTASLRAAQDAFRRAQAIAPDVQVARALVLVSARLQDRAGTTAAYESYLSLARAHPMAVVARDRLELGEALLETGLLAPATDELSAAVAAESSNPDAVVALARAYLQQQDLPSAGRTLESAVARGVTSGAIYAELTDVYDSSGHPANAIAAMRLAIAADPHNEAYRFRYGMLLTDTKAPAAAEIRLKEALADFPDSPRLWFALGVAYFADNKTEEAATAFDKTVGLDTRFAPAYAYLGMAQVDLGRYAEAVKLYEQALAVQENFAAAHYLEAEALLKLEPPDEKTAAQHLDRALALDPSMTQARLERGKHWMRVDRVPEAVHELEMVVAAAPQIAEAHYQLGRAYQRLGNREQAQAQFSEFETLQRQQREQTIAERQNLLKQLAHVRF